MCVEAPDTTIAQEAAVKNSAIAGRAQDLAEKQYGDTQARLAKFDPMFQQLIDQSVKQSTQAAQMTDEQWARQKSIFQPAEDKLVSTALNWDTPERRAAESAQAQADVESQAAAGGQQLDRFAQQRGIDTGSGNYIATKGLMQATTSAQKAVAGNAAEKAVETQGNALVDNAARFGRNLTSTGIETSRLSLQQGQGASGQVGQIQSIADSGAASANGLYGTAVGANNSAGNLSLAAAQAKMAAQSANMSSIGQVLGTGLGAYGALSKAPIPA